MDNKNKVTSSLSLKKFSIARCSVEKVQMNKNKQNQKLCIPLRIGKLLYECADLPWHRKKMNDVITLKKLLGDLRILNAI
jgi:hypothetical protein